MALSAPEDCVGWETNCRHCGQATTVPSTSTNLQNARSTALQFVARPVPPAQQEARPPRQRRMDKRLFAAIHILILATGLFAYSLYLFLNRGSGGQGKTAPPPEWEQPQERLPPPSGFSPDNREPNKAQPVTPDSPKAERSRRKDANPDEEPLEENVPPPRHESPAAPPRIPLRPPSLPDIHPPKKGDAQAPGRGRNKARKETDLKNGAGNALRC
jgi:hypothetical protein